MAGGVTVCGRVRGYHDVVDVEGLRSGRVSVPVSEQINRLSVRRRVRQRDAGYGDRKVIDESDLSPALLHSNGKDKFESAAPGEDDTSPTVALDELERITIQRVFDKVGGDKTKAGELLGISRATLYRKLKRYQIAANQRNEKILA